MAKPFLSLMKQTRCDILWGNDVNLIPFQKERKEEYPLLDLQDFKIKPTSQNLTTTVQQRTRSFLHFHC